MWVRVNPGDLQAVAVRRGFARSCAPSFTSSSWPPGDGVAPLWFWFWMVERGSWEPVSVMARVLRSPGGWRGGSVAFGGGAPPHSASRSGGLRGRRLQPLGGSLRWVWRRGWQCMLALGAHAFSRVGVGLHPRGAWPEGGDKGRAPRPRGAQLERAHAQLGSASEATPVHGLARGAARLQGTSNAPGQVEVQRRVATRAEQKSDVPFV